MIPRVPCIYIPGKLSNEAVEVFLPVVLCYGIEGCWIWSSTFVVGGRLAMVIVFTLTAVLLVLGLVEARRHRKNLNDVPIRILVNGTRGKTTLARLLVASLNAQGIRTMGRTTGSEATIIYPDGSVKPIVRKRRARVYELVPFFREVSLESSRGVSSGLGPVQCVVVECMALQAENQVAFRDWLVRPTHVFITNTYVDHVPEMGPTRESTAQVLGLSVPKGASLYVSDSFYDGLDAKVVHVCEEVPIEDPLIHPSCMAMAWAFLKDMGFGIETLQAGVSAFVPDKGLLEPFPLRGGGVFVPSFSVNDETCMEETIRKWSSSCGGKVNVVFNSRKDREQRILLFKNVMSRVCDLVDDVLVIGDYPKKVAFYIGYGAVSCSVEEVFDKVSSSSGAVFVGLGNIKGAGEELIGKLQSCDGGCDDGCDGKGAV